MNDLALWLKALHIMAFAAWMAGLWYLPRLFVYHSQVEVGTEASAKYQVMERRLLRGITTPAMVATLILGIWLGFEQGQWTQGWLHAKTFLVLILAASHGYMARTVKAFAADQTTETTWESYTNGKQVWSFFEFGFRCMSAS